MSSEPTDHAPPPPPPSPSPSRVGEVARVFLKLGFTAFGGPAAHVALMEEELVTRRRWVDRGHFLDMVSAVNFVPGPNSTELAIHLGYVRAGWPGLLVAGVCFIVPAMLIVLPLAWCYVAYGATPAVGDALVGIKACMVAIVAVALWRFARTGIKDGFTTAVAVAAGTAAVVLARFRVPQQELIILGAAAIAGMLRYGRGAVEPPKASPASAGGSSADQNPSVDVEQPPPQPSRDGPRGGARHAPLLALPISLATATTFSTQLLTLSLFFLKVGATLFGSGYVLASFLHSGLVEQHRWLTEQELLDAIAVGQVTPGPLLTAATFIGYVLGARNFGGGVAGGAVAGVVATLAIFLPSFAFVALLGPVLPRLRRSPRARGALDGMNAAVVALIAVVTLWFARSVIWTGVRVDPLSAIVFGASLALLLGTKVNATWLIIGAGVVGWAVRTVI